MQGHELGLDVPGKQVVQNNSLRPLVYPKVAQDGLKAAFLYWGTGFTREFCGRHGSTTPGRFCQTSGGSSPQDFSVESPKLRAHPPPEAGVQKCQLLLLSSIQVHIYICLYIHRQIGTERYISMHTCI